MVVGPFSEKTSIVAAQFKGVIVATTIAAEHCGAIVVPWVDPYLWYDIQMKTSSSCQYWSRNLEKKKKKKKE